MIGEEGGGWRWRVAKGGRGGRWEDKDGGEGCEDRGQARRGGRRGSVQWVGDKEEMAAVESRRLSDDTSG
jgi:hypothetical protein